VQHCSESFGVVIELSKGGWVGGREGGREGSSTLKIVYSGDCRPSPSLISAGQGCDLLIHEATFDDTRASDALCKRHCTTSEALEVGRRIRARHIVLTHFSQRYPLVAQTVDANNASSNSSNCNGNGNGSGNGSVMAGNKIGSASSNASGNANGTVFSVAFDFLQFAFPSFAHRLPATTRALCAVSSILSTTKDKRREENKDKDKDEHK